LLGGLQVDGELVVKLLQRRRPCKLAVFDLVQFLLHPRRVLDVEQVCETLDQQVVDDRAEFGGPELAFDLLDVFAILNDGHDRGVGRRPPDAFLLERLDQRGFGVARRRFGEMLVRRERVEFQLFALLDLRQFRRALLVVFVLLVLALFINREKAVELDDRARGAERIFLAGGDVDRSLIEDGGHHLRRDEPLPDQPVERQLVLLQIWRDLVRRAFGRGRADRFVRVLRVLLRAVMNGFFWQIFFAVLLDDEVADFRERAFGDARRICAHVGDQPDRALAAEFDSFVQPLRDLHRLLGRKTQLTRRLLLELRGDERRDRVAFLLPGRDVGDDVASPIEFGQDVFRGLLVLDMKFGLLNAVVEAGGLNRLRLDFVKPRVERRRQLRRQVRDDRPVFGFDEGQNVAFALDDQPHGHGLDAPRRKPAPDLVPQQRAHFVPDQAVEHTARLLRVDQIVIDLARMIEGVLDRVLGDLVEHHAEDRLARHPARPGDQFGDVSADGLAFAVRVGRDVDGLGRLSRLFDISDDLLLAWHYFIRRLEIIFDVNAEALFRQVLDVADRGDDFEVLAQIFIDCLRLRWRFDDYE